MVRVRKKRPLQIDLDGSAGELVIDWSDGSQSRFGLAEMRRSCPCAMCREQRGAPAQADGQLRLLEGEAATATAKAVGYVPVGRYGIRISWSDGHDTGIYTFDLLRQER